jgi:hypothetical protein
MIELFYELYKSMRDMVEQFRHKDLEEHARTFVDTQESICNNLDKRESKYYERWKKERFNQQGEVNEVEA